MRCLNCGESLVPTDTDHPCPKCGALDRTVVATDRAQVTDEALPGGVLMRSYFSSLYLFSALRMSEEAGDIETQAIVRPPFDPDHRMFVTGSLFASVSFLEAMVNELFQDVVDENYGHEDAYVAPLCEATRRHLVWLWKQGKGDWLPILQKYDGVLVAAGLDPFDHGSNPYQDAQLVIDVRNALVHYHPRWVGDFQRHPLEAKLRGKQFKPNPLMAGSGNAFFPDHALGHGCTEWAWRSCRALADEFSDRLGLRPNYQRVTFERFKDVASAADGTT